MTQAFNRAIGGSAHNAAAGQTTNISVTDFANATIGITLAFVATSTEVYLSASAEFVQPVAGVQTIYSYVELIDTLTSASMGTSNVQTTSLYSGEVQGTVRANPDVALGGLVVGRSYTARLRNYKTNAAAAAAPIGQYITAICN